MKQREIVITSVYDVVLVAPVNSFNQLEDVAAHFLRRHTGG